jgi:type VI secretion system protein ImpJ
MFIRPHHFQAASRHISHEASLNEKWDQHHNWGLRAIEIDLDALANFRFVVRTLKARLRDGTLVQVPEDGLLPVIELRPAFEKAGRLVVSLAIPLQRLGRANVNVDGSRFRVDTQDLEDENTGLNPQTVHVRVPNLRLLLDTDNQDGYEVIRIARLERGVKADAPPQLDQAYIPPVIACDAWKGLQFDVLQQLYDRLGKAITRVLEQIKQRRVTFDSSSPEDREKWERLRVYNEGYAVLGVEAFAPGTHPLTTYIELCRLVGALSIFKDPRRIQELPRYDHDDLGGCFNRVKQLIYYYLEDDDPGVYEIPFKGVNLRMQVDQLNPAWLEPTACDMYIGVNTMETLNDKQTVRLLTYPGLLDMKVGSAGCGRVDHLYEKGLPGLSFRHETNPPSVLPGKEMTYFQVVRSAQPEEWELVRKSLTFGIRLNELRVVGEINGKEELLLQTQGPQAIKLRFTLYVVLKR